MSSERIRIFGHAKHDAFNCNSKTYVTVPETMADKIQLTKTAPSDLYRIEVMFAVGSDKSISLRMFDPANPHLPATWEITLQGGPKNIHAWNFMTKTIKYGTSGPWPHQRALQMKSDDGADAILGSVEVAAE